MRGESEWPVIHAAKSGKAVAIAALAFLAADARAARTIPFRHRARSAQLEAGGGRSGLPTALFSTISPPTSRCSSLSPPNAGHAPEEVVRALRGARRPRDLRRAVSRRAGSRSLPRLPRAGALRGVARCPRCGSPRSVDLDAATGLEIAHVDCDAFYASVEKRDDPVLRRQAGDRGRVGAAGSRRDLLLRRADLRRALGDADGAARARSVRRRSSSRPTWPNTRGVGREIRALMLATDAAGRAAVDRRGLSRSGRLRRRQWRERGGDARPVRAPRRAGDRRDRLGRPQLLQVPGEARLRSRQAARLRRACGGRKPRRWLAPQSVGRLWGVGKVGPAAAGEVWAFGLIGDLQALDEGARPRVSAKTGDGCGAWRRESTIGG